MSKNYVVQFGVTFWTGLSPTFSTFKVLPAGTTPTGTSAPPGITEMPSSSGLYYFTYEPVGSIAFVIDGTSSLSGAMRYVTGALDPLQAVDERITEMGSTMVAIGNSLTTILGTTASSFGSTAADPATVMGFLKRSQEFTEGMQTFTKSSGVWNIFARGNAVGASTELVQKTITDSGSVITKV